MASAIGGHVHGRQGSSPLLMFENANKMAAPGQLQVRVKGGREVGREVPDLSV